MYQRISHKKTWSQEIKRSKNLNKLDEQIKVHESNSGSNMKTLNTHTHLLNTNKTYNFMATENS